MAPPPISSFVDPGTGWTQATTTDTAGAVTFTPPPAGLYAFNSTLNQWVPVTNLGGGAPSGAAGGDLAGTYPNPAVKGINGVTLAGLGAGLMKLDASGHPAIAIPGTDYPGPAAANTFSGATTFSAPGAASTPGVLISGAPFTAGSATTNTPQLYLNSGATAPTTWSTLGTFMGINTPSTFTGNYFDFRVNGSGSQFSVNYLGVVNCATINSGANILANSTTAGVMGCRISLPQNIKGAGSSPSIAAGTGAGTGPTTAMAAGSTNVAGQISITTGTTPAASATIATITFVGLPAFANPVFVSLTPANAAAAALTGAGAVFVSGATLTFALNSGTTALAAATLYLFNYQVVGS